MSDIEHDSLRYFAARACDEQWRAFLTALADELADQMPLEEMRGFFFAIGTRMAAGQALASIESIQILEDKMNAWFVAHGWGWTRVRDLQNSLEFQHACAPLRAAFGEKALPAASALLEGMYTTWLSQVGAGGDLELRQIGGAEGPADVFRFRLAHASAFN